MDDEPLLTVKEVANYLRVNPRTIYKLVEKGDLICYQVGSVKRFKKLDINFFLERQKSSLTMNHEK